MWKKEKGKKAKKRGTFGWTWCDSGWMWTSRFVSFLSGRHPAAWKQQHPSAKETATPEKHSSDEVLGNHSEYFNGETLGATQRSRAVKTTARFKMRAFHFCHVPSGRITNLKLLNKTEKILLLMKGSGISALPTVENTAFRQLFPKLKSSQNQKRKGSKAIDQTDSYDLITHQFLLWPTRATSGFWCHSSACAEPNLSPATWPWVFLQLTSPNFRPVRSLHNSQTLFAQTQTLDLGFDHVFFPSAARYSPSTRAAKHWSSRWCLLVPQLSETPTPLGLCLPPAKSGWNKLGGKHAFYTHLK